MKKFLVVLLVLAMVLSVVGCTPETIVEEKIVEKIVEKEVEVQAEAEAIVMKVGHSHSTEAIRHIALLEFEKMVEEFGVVEKRAKIEGRQMFMILAPKN